MRHCARRIFSEKLRSDYAGDFIEAADVARPVDHGRESWMGSANSEGEESFLASRFPHTRRHSCYSGCLAEKSE